MVDIVADLPQFLQRRELAAYEQRLSRTAYAYGVDLRRSQWLSNSTMGDPLMRMVDRRWSRLVDELERDGLRPIRQSAPTALLEEIAALIFLLRAPLPTLRILRSEVASGWPAITPLGPTKGAIHWLVLDLDRVMAMSSEERAFGLAVALGHLQCDHGPIFAAHLLSERGHGTGWLKTLMRPWSKLAVFSADRAGLVAVRSLEVAYHSIEQQMADRPDWLPQWPDLSVRRQALKDFDRSSLMARCRLLAQERGHWSVAPPRVVDEPNSAGRRIISAMGGLARLGGRLAMRIDGYERPPTPPEQSGPAPDADIEAGAEQDTLESDLPPSTAPDPEQAARLEHALRGTWSLARCDQRLTHRLGLL